MTVVWTATPPGRLPTVLPGATVSGVCWQADDVNFILEARGVARFAVQSGQCAYEPLGDVDAATVQMIGGGLPLAAAWVQRGYLALHAAAVATSRGAVLFAGPSATGKSVMAAALVQRGYPLLADEVTPVDLLGAPVLTVHPGADGTILLWQDAAQHLGIKLDGLIPLRPGLPRYAMSAASLPSAPLATQPPLASHAAPLLAQPLYALYLLGFHSAPDVQITPLAGRATLLQVMAVAFNRYLPQPAATRQLTFLQLTAKLPAVRVSILLRPRAGWSAARIVDRLEEDWSHEQR